MPARRQFVSTASMAMYPVSTLLLLLSAGKDTPGSSPVSAFPTTTPRSGAAPDSWAALSAVS